MPSAPAFSAWTARWTGSGYAVPRTLRTVATWSMLTQSRTGPTPPFCHTGPVRIIAGRWGGRVLEVPPGIRPMQDRERERLFGILGDRVPGASFLDVFAGSGAIGLEALSRGAARCTLVENGHRVLPVLRRNVEALGAGPELRLLAISAFALPKAGEPGPGSVDVAVLAPPFPLLSDAAMRSRFAALFAWVFRTLLAPGGILVVEHPFRLEAAAATGLGPPADTRRTGESAVSFWGANRAPAGV